MNYIRPYHMAALALLAGTLSVGPSDAWTPSMSTPRPPSPNITIPRVDTSSATRGAIDSARGGVGSSSRSGASGSRSGAKPPPSVKETFVLSGPNGDSATLVVTQFNTELTPNAAAATLEAERIKYRDNDPDQNYRVIDPNSGPTRKQDCGGNAVEQLWGVKNVVVGAENFHNKIIKGLNVPEVDRNNVSDKDVGIFFREGGTPGHIFIVKDARTMTIITKDGNERTRQGVLADNDDLSAVYSGGVKFYHVDPNVIKIKAK